MEDESKSRDRLKKLIKPKLARYVKLPGAKNFKVHFHKPPAKSFYRSWNNEQGDDISSFRSSILKVQETKQPQIAMELGRAGTSIRGIYPIIEQDTLNYLGSVEVFFSPLEILSFLINKSSDDGVILLIDKSRSIKYFKGATTGNFKGEIGPSYITNISSTNLKPYEILSKDVIIQSISKKTYITEIKNNLAISYIPLNDHSGNVIGHFVYVYNFKKDREEIAQTTAFTNGILASIGLLIIIILYLFFKRVISKPIINLTHVFEDMAQGKGDLTVRLNVLSNDEIGRLSKYFNEFLSYLNHMMLNIRRSIEKTKDVSLELADSSTRLKSSLKEVNLNVENVESQYNKVDREINMSSQSTTVLKDFISSVVKLISNQASAITESSSSIEEMSASIQNIARVTEEKLNIAYELEKTALLGESEMRKTVEIIKQVADSAHLIMEMINVINNIAEQTNLLAMNAAIEAAHAGTAGKGFAVVADEIRKLAENTAKNSAEISRSLKEVIDHIHFSEESTIKTGDFFTNIVTRTKDVAVSMMEMKNATQEMALGSNQIISALKSLLNITDDVKSSSSEMDNKVASINDTFQKINIISADTRTRIELITGEMNGLNDNIERVSDSGTKNAHAVSDIQHYISQFKVDDEKNSSGLTSI